MPNKPIFLKKEDVKPYPNPEGKNQICWDIVSRELNPQLSIGFNVMKENACNGVGVHETWDQLFIVTSASGTFVSGESKTRVKAPCLIFIPKGTPHDVLTDENEQIEYYYVNVYDRGV